MTTPTTAPQTPRAREHTETWEGTAGPYLPLTPIVLILLGWFFQSVDTLLAKGSFDILVNETEELSWVVAVGVAGTSAITSFGAGMAWRTNHRIVAGAIAGAWLALGVTMSVLRFNTGVISGSGENEVRDEIMAVLMLVMYVAAGGEVMYNAYKLWNPYYGRLWASRTHGGLVARKLARLEARFSRVAAAITHLTRRKAALDAEYQRVLGDADQMARELADRARLRIAEHLADPERTSLYRSPVIF